ncbi:MAG: hypothetical protein ACM3NT_08990 [Methylocystaceae bacterium]
MNRSSKIKWISLILMVIFLSSGSLAWARENKLGQPERRQVTTQVRSLKMFGNDREQIRQERKKLLTEIKEQSVQVKQLSRSVKQLNLQLKKQIMQMKKGKTQLSAGEIQSLREGLTMVRESSQKLAAEEKKYKQAEQRWRKYQMQPDSDLVTLLETVKTTQEQRINNLTALQTELQNLITLLEI